MASPPTPPGTLIELQATAGGNVATCQLVVRNKAYDGLTLFYDFSRPWCEIMAGARVRFLLRVNPNAEPEVFEGWTLRNGDIFTEHGIVRR
jgi:hypothetical protein